MFDKKVIFTILVSMILATIIALYSSNKDKNELNKALFINKTYTKKKYDVIVAGDSRTYRGISSKIINNKLNLSVLNLGYSSAGFNKTLFDKIDEKISQKSKNKILILGITPFSLTAQASFNGHLKRLESLKKEEVLEYMYLFPVKSFYYSITPDDIRKLIIHKGSKNENYQQEYHINEGWIASWYLKPNEYAALKSYKKTFTDTKISNQIIENLYIKIQEWKKEGISVFGYIVPSSINMTELERNIGKFNQNKFIKGFIKVGGEWINIENKYISYDGSHLEKESAIHLSEEISSKILNNNIISKYDSTIKVNNIYNIDYIYKFETTFEKDTGLQIEKGKGILGSNAVFVDKKYNTFVLYKERLRKKGVKKISLEVCVLYKDKQSIANLICNIGGSITSFNSNYTCIPNKWCRLYLTVDFPEKITNADDITVLIKSKKGTKIYIDDFRLYML